MINELFNSLCSLAIKAIDTLPNVVSFEVPQGIYNGINQMFSFVGWIMPYNLYLPLLTFILSLTAFRIAYAIYIHFFKR